MQEQRKHTRLEIVIQAEIKTASRQKYIGKSKNISFGGAFIILEETPDLRKNEKVDLIFKLSGGDNPIKVEIQCLLVHLYRKGMGLQFSKISSDDYIHFKNLMVYNSDEPDILSEELKNHPGIMVKK
jgi:c-di-GMP-binding flagellar brake protein YcgR